MAALLERFVDAFLKAIDAEMEAMRQRLGPFEVPLGAGRRLEGGEEGRRLYRFAVLQGNDKLVPQSECDLRAGAQEHLVTVSELEGDQVVLECGTGIDLGSGPFCLVIYPWFLYERLKGALRALLESDTYCIDSALAAFGQAPPRDLAGPVAAPPPPAALNPSQQRAVDLCCRRSPAFVWGPPGTGKTTTLGHIVVALLGQGLRVLVTSTTIPSYAIRTLAGNSASAAAWSTS